MTTRFSKPQYRIKRNRSRRLAVETLENRRVLATMSVTNLNDAGQGSLREAIEIANANPGEDTIEFDDSLSGGTIELQSELLVSDKIEINPTAVDITISGTEADPTPDVHDGQGIRLFHFTSIPVTPSFSPSRIQGLRLTGGDVTGSGGAIYSMHGIVLTDVTVASNAATEDGGGVFISSEESSGFGLVQSVFEHNFAMGDGGAAKLINNRFGYAAVDDSEFRENQANGSGGALDIENYESFTLVSHSDLEFNEADIAGAVNVFTEGGQSQIEFTLVRSNVANSMGGINSMTTHAGIMVVFDTDVIGNNGRFGNGGAQFASANNGQSRIANSTFNENTTILEGGGLTLHASRNAIVTADNITVQGNHSDYTGGGVRLLSFDGGNAGLTRSRVSGNSGLIGGGAELLVGTDSYASIFNSAIYDNFAQFDGGGVNIEAAQIEATAAIVNSTISGNSAGRNGGGVRMYANREGHQIEIRHSTIVNNVANADPMRVGKAGGVYGNFRASTQSITHSIIANNFQQNGDEQIASDLGGAFGSVEYSLVQSLVPNATMTGDGNIIGEDPQLAPLSDNGGFSKTHAIARTSPAYNAGDIGNTGPFAFDQRGRSPFERVHGNRIDIGAFELTDAPSGDFSGDRSFDCTDIDILTSQIASGRYSAAFDMNQDAALNLDDVTMWLAAAGEANLGAGLSYLVGDANLDGNVDISDYNIWNANKFTENTAWCSGNFNADSSVDVQDFNQWNANRFQSASRPNLELDNLKDDESRETASDQSQLTTVGFGFQFHRDDDHRRITERSEIEVVPLDFVYAEEGIPTA